MIKLCIFDLDGTVLDTVKTIAYYVNTTLENNGIEPIEVEQFKYLAGRGMADLIRRSLEFRNCYEDALYTKVLGEYDAAYNANVAYKTTIFDGLKETLDNIKALGIRIAIVSNKPDFATRTVVNALYGEGYFDFVTGQVPGGVLKPDPAVVLSVMEKFGASQQECLYIGDTSTDMQTGNNAGLFTIGVLWGFRGREELLENGADLLIEKPHELYDYIARLKQVNQGEKAMISYHSLLPFGCQLDGGLQIKDSFSFVCPAESSADCILVNALSAYTGEKAPKIQFVITVDGQATPLYASHAYRIGKSGEYTRQTWRVPPLFLPNMTLTICVKIPEGTILSVKNFGSSHDTGATDWNGGPRHNAHLGFWGMAPDNTMPAFELAAACGFPACIVVPKVTKDGIFVCLHDDKMINRTARDAQGNAPEEEFAVKDKTYDELQQWEFGSYKNEIYKGTKLPLLSDFFDLCAKTGMRPMFSTHPGLTPKQWQRVKDMLQQRGLLKNFHVKSFNLERLKMAYSVLGTEIDGYTYDIGTWNDSLIDDLLVSGIDNRACRVGMEIKFADYTEQIAASIRNAGFFAAAWNIKRRDFEEYEKLMSWGVTEFTEDYHCSMGLNY